MSPFSCILHGAPPPQQEVESFSSHSGVWMDPMTALIDRIRQSDAVFLFGTFPTSCPLEPLYKVHVPLIERPLEGLSGSRRVNEMPVNLDIKTS